MVDAETLTLVRLRSRLCRRFVLSAVTVIALGLGGTACGKSSSGSRAPNAAGKTNPSSAPSTAREVSPAGDIPDNQAYVPYAPPGQGYSLKVPEGWARIAQGGATVFTDKLNSIRTERVNLSRPPTVATVTAIEVPKLAKRKKQFKAGNVSTVRRSAGTAILLTYAADGPPDAVTAKVPHLAVERYEFWHNGHAVSLTLSGAKGADNVDPWKIVTNSFRWKP